MAGGAASLQWGKVDCHSFASWVIFKTGEEDIDLRKELESKSWKTQEMMEKVLMQEWLWTGHVLPEDPREGDSSTEWEWGPLCEPPGEVRSVGAASWVRKA